MKSFKEYLNEEMMPYAQTEKGFVGVDNGPVRDNINIHLASITAKPYATPYHAMEMIRKVLAPFSIFPPSTNFLDGDSGHEIFSINQFGNKMGMTNDGKVVVKNADPYFVYFEYAMNDTGSFDIFCEIVTEDELDEILSDIEDEMEDGDTTSGDMKDAEDSYDEYKSDNQLKEEQLDELKIGKKELIAAMKRTTGYDAGDDEGRIDPDKLIARARKYHGEKFAKDLAGAHNMTSRPNRNVVPGQWGSDKLKWREQDNASKKTKSGKANRTKLKGLEASLTKGDYRKPDYPVRNLPEEKKDLPWISKGDETKTPKEESKSRIKKLTKRLAKKGMLKNK